MPVRMPLWTGGGEPLPSCLLLRLPLSLMLQLSLRLQLSLLLLPPLRPLLPLLLLQLPSALRRTHDRNRFTKAGYL